MLNYRVGSAGCIVILVMSFVSWSGSVAYGQSQGMQPLREELAKRQRSDITLAAVDGSIHYFALADRKEITQAIETEPARKIGGGGGMVTADGTMVAFPLEVENPYRIILAIAKRGGAGLKQFPEIISPYYYCWSPDNSKLVVSAAYQRQPHGMLMIADLNSGQTRHIELSGYTNSQCWSADGQKIVYGVGDRVLVYSMETGKSESVAMGTEPNWMPDGKSISFLRGNTYYAKDWPVGKERPLFSREGAKTALWWSPDGKLVAFLRTGGKYDRDKHFDFGPRELLIRRVFDGAEEVLQTQPDVAYVPSYQWVSFNKIQDTQTERRLFGSEFGRTPSP